ncbi:MAG: LPS assembly lipoprotein LptE [Pseudomonadota bacterium]
MRQIFRWAILSVAVSSLAACSVQPLYVPDQKTGQTGALAIPLENPSDRDDQLVRNALLDLIGWSDGSSGYTGEIGANVAIQSVFRSNAPDSVTAINNRRVVVTATLTITNTKTGEQAGKFTGVGRTFFESSRQQFANDRSQMDAEQRAASEAAESLRNQLAVFLGRNPVAPDLIGES